MPAKVFVSYSHDSDEHKARVRVFVAHLIAEGIDVVYDQDVAGKGGPDEGWHIWCRSQVVECDYVLACCTAPYCQRFDGTDVAGGVLWEAHYIRQYLYENGVNRKIRNVIFDNADVGHVPVDLRRFHVFHVFGASQDEGYEQLLAWVRPSRGGDDLQTSSEVAWPEPPGDFLWRLADRSPEFGLVKGMLSGRNPHRALLVHGSSNSGKSALVHGCVGYAQHSGVPSSLIDFKGGRPLDDVFGTLLLDLGKATLPETYTSEKTGRALKVIEDLQALKRPVFIAFDTYQEAPLGAQDWIENLLLPRIARCPALIVAVAGQAIPEHSGRSWAPLAYTTALRPILSAEDWWNYTGREYGSTPVTREQIETLTRATHGNPGLTSSLIGGLVQSLAAG